MTEKITESEIEEFAIELVEKATTRKIRAVQTEGKMQTHCRGFLGNSKRSTQ